MKEDLLAYCYAHKKEFLLDVGESGLEEFNCLIVLIEEGDITSMEQLHEYGI